MANQNASLRRYKMPLVRKPVWPNTMVFSSAILQKLLQPDTVSESTEVKEQITQTIHELQNKLPTTGIPLTKFGEKI